MNLNKLCISSSFDPYTNLAIEQHLFETYTNGIIFYLWQNDKTVVIGKHQNAFKECNINLLKDKGLLLARRNTGGGAVYHDLGNLCFSFIGNKENYDISKQLSLIIDALKDFKINAHFTGRNDLVLDDNRKFSGNAFKHTDNVKLHHGTIMLDADLDVLQSVLTPSKIKFTSKGFESVKSRVVNLNKINNSITVADLKGALINSFKSIYGTYSMIDIDSNNIYPIRQKICSYEWIYGNQLNFDMEINNHFTFGDMDICLSLSKGIITNCKIYSDAMDLSFVETINKFLINEKLDYQALSNKIRNINSKEAIEVSDWLLTI